MDQVILLLRNPRWAIPSYHNMRFELNYAADWTSSYIRIPFTYTTRPAIAQWELWRDSHFDIEIDRWAAFYKFYLQGGLIESTNTTHSNCLNNDIDCHPKAVVNFEHFYSRNPSSEYSKITSVLDNSTNVEIIAAKARACVLDAVFNRPELHQKNRLSSGIVPPMYKLTLAQHDRLLNRTIEVRNKFSEDQFLDDPIAQDFVTILDEYHLDNIAEHTMEASIFLDNFIQSYFGVSECDDLLTSSTTSSAKNREVCVFMKDRNNHLSYTDGVYPDDFPHSLWLEVRIVIMYALVFVNHSRSITKSCSCSTL